MNRSSRERLKAVALIAAVLALCISGVAGAGRLLDGGDVRNNSIQFKDLSKRAKAKLRGSIPRGSLLVSSFEPPSNATSFVAPGGDYALPEAEQVRAEMHVPTAPSSGFRATSLRVRSLEGGTGSPIDSQSFTLRVNGADTALSCVTNIANGGLCQDTGRIAIGPGARLAVKADINTGAFISVTLALTIEGA